MLTPVTPNPIANSTTIKSHGSESRTAPGHNAIEAQAQPQATNHSQGIGLDAGSILANVNAEAATAGNRTILQTLALAVAAQLNIIRRNDETMEAFFQRIASALDDMPPDERAAMEIRAGLKMLKIQLPELSAALKQPDGALAARLSATAEAPLATPQKTAAAAATTTYLQEAPGVSRAAETLAMVTQSRTSNEGNGLFSSSAPTTLPAPENPTADARSLQSQLKSLFEPGVAETRIEIAEKVEQPKVLILGANDDLPDVPVTAATDEQQSADVEPALTQATETSEGEHTDQPAANPATARQTEAKPIEARAVEPKQNEVKQAETKHSEAKPADGKPVDAKPAPLAAAEGREANSVAPHAESRPEPRMLGLPVSQNNNIPSASLRLRAIARELVQEKLQANPTALDKTVMVREDNGDQRMQTMLTLKGIAEVITTMPAKAAEFLMSPQLVADIQAKELKNSGVTAQAANADLPTEPEMLKAETAARKDAATAVHTAPSAVAANDDAEEARSSAARSNAGESQTAARATEEKTATALIRTPANLEPVPFAYAALQPAKEEFKAEAKEERARYENEGEDGADQEPEDEEARRERLARKATDDLLRPEPEAEPELKITRDSSQADRAYALYQRMAGF